MERWPNLFIVGAPKAGTSSLYAYLRNVPKIYMSPIKEPNYFSVNIIPDDHDMQPIRDKKKYLNLFQKAKVAEFVGEASPTYLSDPEAPKLIHQVSPDARIIASLRDPVDRAFSQYLMMVRLGQTKLSFYEEVQNVIRHKIYDRKPYVNLDFGLYYESIMNYKHFFGNDNVKILVFEELISKTKEIFEEVLLFLNIVSSVDEFTGETHNPFGIARGPVAQYVFRNAIMKRLAERIISPKYRRILREKILIKKAPKPKMEREAKEVLVRFYYDDVQKLQKALGRKLPWHNFQH
jgi:hypothetical protein